MSEKDGHGIQSKKGAKSFVVGESFISCPDRTFGRPYCFLPYPRSSFSSSSSSSSLITTARPLSSFVWNTVFVRGEGTIERGRMVKKGRRSKRGGLVWLLYGQTAWYSGRTV